MNFSTEALDHLNVLNRALIEDGLIVDSFALEKTIADLTSATKFLIPSPGHMNVVATKATLKYLRLPYPICAFEYSCPEARAEGVKGASQLNTAKSSRRIALAYDCSKNVGPVPALKAAGYISKDSTGILVQSIYYIDKYGVWAPSFAAGYVDEDTGERNQFLLDNKRLFLEIEACPIMTQSINAHFGHLTGQDLTFAMLNDVGDEVGMAIRACLLLNTRNLKIVKAVEAPTALNKKRAKKGKPPFFEYHTLDIFISDAGSRLARKRVDSTFVRNHFANLNNVRKWGSVIGHFKLRATGMFFWNAHTRGDKATGVVVKDYNVKQKP